MRTRKTYIPAGAAIPLAGLAVLALLLAGCATNGGPDSVTPAPLTTQPLISGKVYGGQNPLSGSTIQLYAVGSGLKAASTPLIGSTVTTLANGSFNITGTYNCTGNPLVYLVATGGNAGGGANSSVSLMAALGLCGNLQPTTYIVINEVTTVATVYALAQFMSGYSHVGAASTNTAGLTNAFQNALNLVNTTTGLAPGASLPATATVPATELYTIANVLAACVNTASGSIPCNTLFSAATPSGGTAPTDTAGAALNIATHPGNNVASLFTLSTATPPFQPTLATAPNDWTLAVKFADPSLKSPYGLAIDASGDVWVTNQGGASVTKMSSAGAVLSGASGFTGGGLLGPKGIAMDKTGDAWIANTGASSVVEISPTGSVLSGASGFTGGSIDAPVALAIDSQANVWVANYAGNSVTVLNSAGTANSASPLNDSGAIVNPTGIAIDKSGYGWVSNGGANNLLLIQPYNGSFYYETYTDNAIQGPLGIAVDSSGVKWLAATGINAVSVISGSAASPIRSAAFNVPTGVAVDGGGSIWITNGSAAGGLAELSSAGAVLSPATGYGSLNTPVGIAIDSTGSLWTADLGDNSVTQFVGIASPVTTPIAATVGP